MKNTVMSLRTISSIKMFSGVVQLEGKGIWAERKCTLPLFMDRPHLFMVSCENQFSNEILTDNSSPVSPLSHLSPISNLKLTICKNSVNLTVNSLGCIRS